MMNEWLNDYLKQLEGYPEKVLSSAQLLESNIQYMRLHTDHEWFNIASALLSIPSAGDVRSLKAWRTYYKDPSINVRRGVKACPLLVPEVKEDHLQLTIVPGYDIQQLQESVEIRKPRNMVQYVVHVRKLRGAKETLTDETFCRLIEEYLYLFPWETIDEGQKEFLLNCVRYAYKKEIRISADLPMPVHPPGSKKEAIRLYKQLKDVLGFFHIFLAEILIQKQTQINKEENEKMIEKFQSMGIKNQIAYLQNRKDFSIEDVPMDDTGIPEENEGDSYLGEIE